MSTRIVHRPGRLTVPVTPPAEVLLEAPPPLDPGATGSLPTQLVLPLLGGLTSVTMMVVMRNGQKVFMLIAALILVVAVVTGLFMVLSTRGQQLRNRAHQRDLYLDHLEDLRARLGAETDAARAAAERVHPPTDRLAGVVRDPARLWERRATDDDFLAVRLGVADRPWFQLTVPPAQGPTQPHDPAMLAETERLVRAHATVSGMPVEVPLDTVGSVALVGPRDAALPAARTLVAQAAAFHSPDDLHIALAVPSERLADWRGVDALPHMVAGRLFDGPVPARRIASSAGALGRLLGDELVDRLQAASAQRRAGASRVMLPTRLLVVVDTDATDDRLPLPGEGFGLADLGITVVQLVADRRSEPGDVSVRVTLDEGGATVDDLREDPDHRPAPVGGVRVDPTSAALLAGLARQLAPLRITRSLREVADAQGSADIGDLLGFTSVESIDLDRMWRPRGAADFLRVPIGTDDHGEPLLLDLKESAQLGMGPHGICIGATGSGKSEMLRTLVLALALNHPPEDLSMILVDYKGGAAFSPFSTLPHLAGLIDNLADDAQLTERARQSIQGEVVRRQQQLKDAGHLASIGHYRQLRATDRPDLPPMPHLFVVIDEFGELLTAEPEFTDLFLQIGRIGRSIGVHLLLSSQRIEAGKLRGLDTYLSYRIGLRTFSESESQVVLDTRDAYHLPPLPGYGYLKVDTSVYQRFRAGYVSGRLDPEAAAARVDTPDAAPAPMLLPAYNTLASGQAGREASGPPAELAPPVFEVQRTLVDACVERLRGVGRGVAPVWLPPLPDRLALGRVAGEPSALDLGVTMGLIDDPSHQAQTPWVVDLTRGGGHVAVIGAPQSGRTTFLRTMAVSLALTHRPAQVSIYGMDATGAALARIEGFPHVGGVATRAHPARMKRLIEELAGMLAQREAVFRAHDIDSLGMLRRLHAEGRLPQLPSADIVVLVDGYGLLKTDFEELVDPLNDLMAKAGSFGIHFVVALGRWGDLRIAQQALFGTRFELRLNDPTDSIIDRRLSQTITADRVGRVVTDGKLFAQVALPTLEDVPDDQVTEAMEELARHSRELHQGQAAAPIRLLPLHLSPDVLVPAHIEPDAIPFGLRQDNMDNAMWELLGPDQHLLVFGDARSGKSTLLRTLARGLVARYTGDELIIAVMDTRGTVPGVIPDDLLGGHARSAAEARGLAVSIAAELERRAGLPREARAGLPRIVLLVDDFDILDAGGHDPLGPLLPHLPSARDLAFHVVLTRPVSGVGRALYGATIQALRDTSGSLFVMSGDRGEGLIVPRIHAQAFPPGRGQFVRRAENPFIAQVAMDPEATA